MQGDLGRRSAPRISIALATYNGEAFLPDQLESYAAQTCLPDELVIGDDGSSDGTIALLERFAVSAPFEVKIVRNPKNLGYSRNFCEIAQRCSGDVIFLSDQDDVWYPEKIEACMAALERPGALLVTHDAQLADAELNPGAATMLQQLRASGSKDPQGLMNGCCMAFRRELIHFLDVPPRDFHDMWLGVISALMEGRVYLREPLILYRRHGSNASGSHLTSLRGASVWAALRNRIRQARSRSGMDALQEAMQWTGNILEGFQKHMTLVVDLVGLEKYQSIVRSLKADLMALERRQAIISRNRVFRPWGALRLFRAGGYRNRGGALSMMRDISGL